MSYHIHTLARAHTVAIKTQKCRFYDEKFMFEIVKCHAEREKTHQIIHFTFDAVYTNEMLGTELKSSTNIYVVHYFLSAFLNVHSEPMVCMKCFQCKYSHKAVCRRTKTKLRHYEMDAFNSNCTKIFASCCCCCCFSYNRSFNRNSLFV